MGLKVDLPYTSVPLNMVALLVDNPVSHPAAQGIPRYVILPTCVDSLRSQPVPKEK